MQKFIRPHGHNCRLSTGLGEEITFGTGDLDSSGYWSKPCHDCARAWEEQFPEDSPCWPFTDEQIRKMGFETPVSTVQI